MAGSAKSQWQGIVWKTREGGVLSCVEKLKVLADDLAEIEQVCQDAFEDALLMGCDERQVRDALLQIVIGLNNPYTRD